MFLLSETNNLKSNSFILSILVLQAIVYFVIYMDIPLARMVICFIYLLFVPGIVILKLLAMKTLDVSEKILFSVGLSIAFLMFFGVALNELGKLFFTDPLSLNLLILGINTTLLLAAFVGSRRTDSSLEHTPKSNFSRYLFLIMLFVSFFFLGAYGIFTVNYSGNSIFILLLLLFVAVIVSLAFLSERIVPSKFYPLLLLIVFVSTLLFTWDTLVTPYITGRGDQWLEYYFFKLTGGLWNSQGVDNAYYSMISITILPTIFSTITAIESSFYFKLFYPLVVSFIAIGTYKLYQTQTDKKTAFLSTFFLIAISLGKGMGPARQQIAELFYVLLLLMLFKKGVPHVKKNLLLIVFGTALVLSHYGQTYIFLLTMIAAFLLFTFINYIRTGRINIYEFKIPLTFIMFFAIITFSWYIYIGGSTAFDNFIQAMSTVTNNLNQFFNPASRGTALEGLGLVETPSIFYQISRALFLLTEFLLVIGLVKVLTRSKQTSGFSKEYKILAALNFAIILTNILLPRLADTFLMARFYQITLILLAPMAVVGGKAILDFILNHRFQKFYGAILLLLVFVPLFLFQTNFVYEVSHDKSYNPVLSMYRWNSTELHGYFTDTQEVIGAQWMSQHVNYSNVVIFSDFNSLFTFLTSYGLITGSHMDSLSDIIYFSAVKTNLIALTFISDVELANQGYFFNVTEVFPILENQNIIYSNGKCEIYMSTTS